MKFRYDFLISELLFRVESGKQLQIPDNFHPFQTDTISPRDPDILLQVSFGITQKLPDPHTPENVQDLEYIYWKDGEYIIRQMPAGRGSPCRLFIPEGFAEYFCRSGKWLLYMPMERLLLPFGRLFLHASAVIYQGKAYLFSGPSGCGKSTHATLWEKHYGAAVLNGDKVLIHPGPSGAVAYGSPVSGSSDINKNLFAPIAGIYLLEQRPYNRLSPVSGSKALIALYSESIKSKTDSAFNEQLLDLLMRLLRTVPVHTLECLPEVGAVDCIRTQSEGKD